MVKNFVLAIICWMKMEELTKPAIFIMENNPLERQEIEDTIHALVKQQIELFSKNETNNGQLAAVAEIPLFLNVDGKMPLEKI